MLGYGIPSLGRFEEHALLVALGFYLFEEKVCASLWSRQDLMRNRGCMGVRVFVAPAGPNAVLGGSSSCGGACKSNGKHQ